MSNKIRVRFAPSPTGYLHVGGARTAIFNYLFARHHKGKFILRIEDTDQERYQSDALKEIFESLDWLGLEFDEGPDKNGGFGPYIQSQRTHLYRQAAKQLIKTGHAYRCFCSKERMEKLRETQKKKKDQIFGYDRHCLNLTPREIDQKLQQKIPFVVRLKIPRLKNIVFNDLIRGEIKYSPEQLDDIVLLKSDGFPTYHLANVVDDWAMQITHVMRGEEWISSTPKHVILYHALGYQEPKFAHLPVILANDGGKLSKRKGAASVMDYKKQGYLPEAMVNFLSLLGWSPGDDTEIMQKAEIINRFTLDRVTAKASVFDEQKLIWLNGHYLRDSSLESILPDIMAILDHTGLLKNQTVDKDYLKKAVNLLKDRSKTLNQIAESLTYFFWDPTEYDEKTARKRFKGDSAEILKNLIKILQDLPNFKRETIEEAYRTYAEERKLSGGKLIHPTRLAVSGVGFGPGLFEMLELIGKDPVIRRMETAVRWIHKNPVQGSQENGKTKK